MHRIPRPSIHSRKFIPWLALAIIAFLPASLPAQFIFKQVNLAYLTRRADVIVQGRVTNVRYEPLPGYDHIRTVRVTLAVEQMLRGPESHQYTFRQMLPPGRAYTGKYGYQVGQELMLFLPSPSQYGLSSPLAHEQGTFHIHRDAQGHGFIANLRNNAGLFNNVASQAADQGLTLHKSQLELSRTASGPVQLDRFISLVRNLATLPRIE